MSIRLPGSVSATWVARAAHTVLFPIWRPQAKAVCAPGVALCCSTRSCQGSGSSPTNRRRNSAASSGIWRLWSAAYVSRVSRRSLRNDTDLTFQLLELGLEGVEGYFALGLHYVDLGRDYAH